MSRGLAAHLLRKELVGGTTPRDLPQPSTGCLVLDEKLRPAAFPGGPLSWMSEPVHYLDLGGIQAISLKDFGGSPELWAGVTKLYASNCGLRSLDGVEQLTGVLWLYLDNNALEESELLKLLNGLPGGQLKALDVSGNPGCGDEVLEALESGGLLSSLEYLNGVRWKPSPSAPRLPSGSGSQGGDVWDI